MKKSGLPPIAWGLVGLLAVAAFLISFGKQDNDTSPESNSYSPSGISAFCELLRKHGYSVVLDRQPRPHLLPTDIAVAFRREPMDLESAGEESSAEAEFQAYFWRNVSAGGTGIVLPIQKDFLSASQLAAQSAPVKVRDFATGDLFDISTSVPTTDEFGEPSVPDSSVDMTLWTAGKDPYLRAYHVDKGTALVVRDGIGITNRFIDKNDNARAFAAMLAILAKPGSRIVFTEASFGNVQELSLLETIGPWANAAWQQLLFLGVVVVLTLGKRFGTSEEPRPIQRGSRELLDALADTFRRARSTQTALAMAYERADADLRLMLKLPKDASRAERDRLLPPTLQNAIARLDAARQMDRVSPEQALELVKRCQSELDSFVGPHRTKLRRLAKLRI